MDYVTASLSEASFYTRILRTAVRTRRFSDKNQGLMVSVTALPAAKSETVFAKPGLVEPAEPDERNAFVCYNFK